MIKRYKTFISTLAITGFLLGSNVNAQNIENSTYETYTKSTQRTYTSEEPAPKEAIDDINSLNSIKYLQTKTNSKYEIAYAHPDGTYTYIDKSETIEDAIQIANQQSNKRTNNIPVVINEEGLVVYATQGIGRIVRIVNGVVDSSISMTTNLYKDKNLTTPEHTYINHAFIDDAPIIEDEGNIVKVEVNGYTGYMKKQESDGSINIVTMPLNQVKNLSYYSVNSLGELVHNISSDITVANKSNAINIGPAPSFLNKSTKYYSYDGMYFYTDINKLISDTKSGNHKSSINANNPFYNYYLNLPGRSKTSYTADDLNRFIAANTPSTSVLRNTGAYFISAQEKYGVNPIMSLGIAMNESAKGDSDIAKNNFNIFGANAKDAFPQGASKFSSIEECIDRVSNYALSNNYFNPKSWKYNNSNLGNKSFGLNVRYASDPYWGEKAVNYMYMIDKHLNMKDYNKYTLGMYINEANIYNGVNEVLYKVLGATSRKNIFGQNPAQGQVGDTTIIVAKGSSTHQVQPDRGVPITSQNTNGDGTYTWNKTGFVSSSSIKILNGKQQPSVDYENHWASSAIKDFISKGHIGGYEDGSFKPNGEITRAEFIKIVNSVYGFGEKGAENFTDVNPNNWFYDGVCIAMKAGYVNGYEDGTFRPNGKITRQEAAKIIVAIEGKIDNNLDKVQKYADYKNIPKWAQSCVEGAIENGYMSGYGNNTFRPTGKITRAESVVTLSRVKR